VSLTRKLVLAFLLVSTVPLGAVIGVLYFTSVKHAKEQVDVTSGGLRASLGQNASGYLVYWDAHRRQRMAGYTRLRAYGANQAGNWQLITLTSYGAILAPVTQSFNRTFGILLATLVGAVGLGFGWRAT
jgi:hypothetical protein